MQVLSFVLWILSNVYLIIFREKLTKLDPSSKLCPQGLRKYAKQKIHFQEKVYPSFMRALSFAL